MHPRGELYAGVARGADGPRDKKAAAGARPSPGGCLHLCGRERRRSQVDLKFSKLKDAAALLQKGVISDCKYGLKILANGKLTKKITVRAKAFSESAKAKIEEAGGKVEVV